MSGALPASRRLVCLAALPALTTAVFVWRVSSTAVAGPVTGAAATLVSGTATVSFVPAAGYTGAFLRVAVGNGDF